MGGTGLSTGGHAGGHTTQGPQGKVGLGPAQARGPGCSQTRHGDPGGDEWSASSHPGGHATSRTGLILLPELLQDPPGHCPCNPEWGHTRDLTSLPSVPSPSPPRPSWPGHRPHLASSKQDLKPPV